MYISFYANIFLLEYVIPYSDLHLSIAFQGMSISPMPIIPEPTTPTAPPLPTTTTTTTIQGSINLHETPPRTHDPQITKMATEETRQEITSTEIDVTKGKNYYICLLHGII